VTGQIVVVGLVGGEGVVDGAEVIGALRGGGGAGRPRLKQRRREYRQPAKYRQVTRPTLFTSHKPYGYRHRAARGAPALVPAPVVV